MKTWKFLPIMAIGVCMAMTSCSEDSKKEDVSPNPFAGFNTPDSGTATDDELKAAVATYVDDVVIPTYEDMYNKVTALNTAVQKLSTSSIPPFLYKYYPPHYQTQFSKHDMYC